MDSFNYCLEDRGLLVVDDMEFPVNSFGRINNFVKDFAFKDIHDLDKTMFILDGGETVAETESVESIFRHTIGEFHLNNPCLRVDHSVVKVPSTSMSNLDQFIGDLGFGSEISDSCYNSIDKKVDSENPTDFIKGCSRVSSEGSIVSSLVEDSLPAKRAQSADFQFQVPHCQVQGCYKDLSSYKDYHKRHRVCDVHSKSVKVVINGIENRFCQQCSRFHLLKEFDDVKRSCRKRLAGHNKRRRRPQLGVDSGVLQIDLLESGSFLLTEERPADFYYQEKHVDGNQSKCIRLENVPGAGKVEFAMPLDYGCAPSLLSFESKTLSSYSPGSSEVLNPVIGGKYPAYETTDNKCFHHPMLYDGSTDVCSNVQICGRSQSSESMLNYCHFPEAGSTLDLMNLSSHLRRVEQQQNSMQVKQETFSFSCSTSQ